MISNVVAHLIHHLTLKVLLNDLIRKENFILRRYRKRQVITLFQVPLDNEVLRITRLRINYYHECNFN